MRSASATPAASPRERDGAVGGRDPEAFSLLLERHRRSSCEGLAPVRANVRQDAELVAADAVDLALTHHGCAQLLRDSREERVAGGMAEGVVVGLEPVEVEQHQDRGRARVECAAEVDHQLAPVAHARERVRLRFDPGRREQLHLLAEGEGHPCDHGQHRGRGKDGCRLVQRLELSVDEDPERGQAEDRGQRQHPGALGADGTEPARGLPGSGSEEEHRERPAGVEQLDAVRRADRRPGRGRRCRRARARAVLPRMHSQARSSRQPVIARTATTMPSSRASASGYARFIAAVSGEPPVLSTTAPNRTAAPTAATASAASAASSQRLRSKCSVRARTRRPIPA